MMRVAIMQPTYMPWIGYFAMIDEVDLFVFLDHVQLNKRSWQTRNRIKERDDKELMLSIPLHTGRRDETRICDATFVNDDWKHKHITSIIQNYRKCKCYDEILPLLEELYSKEASNLADYNVYYIEKICKYLGVRTTTIRSSQISGISGKKDDLLVSICKHLNADNYLSAKGSALYIESETPAGAFGRAGINLEYQNYTHPTYRQKGGIFMPYMGVVDILLNCGKESLEIIRSGVNPPLDSCSVLYDLRD